MINVAGNEGVVTHISLFLTILENVKGDKIYTRNSEIVNHTITNYSTNPGQLITVSMHLPGDQDISKAVVAIEKAIVNFTPELKDKNRQPVVLVQSMMGLHFVIEVRAYVMERFDYSSEKTRLFTLSVDALREAGFTL